MAGKVTIKDIALKAGVSHATVSMVFSNETRISEKTRQKVMQVAKRLKYVRNIGASNLRRGKSNLIGFIVNDIANPVYGKMAQIAESIAWEHGYQLIIADHQWNPESEVAAIRKMISFQARGLLLCSTEQSDVSFELLNSPGSPAVVAVENWSENYKGANIGYDVYTSGQVAARHLLEAGCTNPVLFTANQKLRSFSSFVTLQNGFLDLLEKHGLSKSGRRVIYAGLTSEEGRDSFHRMQATGMGADGIFCINDMCAYGVIAAADEAGVHIGKDIALMGIGDSPLSAAPRISLTSIRQPPEEIIRLAVEELIASFVHKRSPNVHVKLPPELIVRQSSRLANPRQKPGPLVI